jgi:hypothetical protein
MNFKLYLNDLSVRNRGYHQGKVVLLFKVSMLPLAPGLFFNMLTNNNMNSLVANPFSTRELKTRRLIYYG